MCVCAHANDCLCVWTHAKCPFHTSFSWYWLRAQTAPRCQLERPRSGRLSMIKFTSAKPFWLGGGLRMVDGAFGIQEHQSYCPMYTKIQYVHAAAACNTFTQVLYLCSITAVVTLQIKILHKTKTYLQTKWIDGPSCHISDVSELAVPPKMDFLTKLLTLFHGWRHNYPMVSRSSGLFFLLSYPINHRMTHCLGPVPYVGNHWTKANSN